MEDFYNYYEESDFDTNEIDEGNISIKGLENLLSIPMDLSMELIAEWKRKGKLIMDPNFQRREVWNIKQMSQFIESLILGIPIPSVLLADDKKNNRYVVIDGKQRLNTIIEFLSCEKEGQGFKLKGLEILDGLNNYDYHKLLTDGKSVHYLSRFQDAILKASIVKNYTEDQLYFIFNRLNTGSVPLSTQELRQSLFPGKFLNYVNEFSYDNESLKKVLGIKKPDKRMKDVELVVRYFSFKFFRKDYSNSLNKFFNNTCIFFNDNWIEKESIIKEECIKLTKAIDFVFAKLGTSAFKAYLQNKETNEWRFGPINRPMFDLLSVVFSEEENRTKINNNNIDLEAFIMDLFTNNERFYDAFLPTTHSKDKTDRRFDLFFERFNQI